MIKKTQSLISFAPSGIKEFVSNAQAELTSETEFALK
jgi:hypothetical protein